MKLINRVYPDLGLEASFQAAKEPGLFLCAEAGIPISMQYSFPLLKSYINCVYSHYLS